MANIVTPKGMEGLEDGTLDLDTDTINEALLDLDVNDTAIKAVTGATNATPIVLTVTAHGFANGDVVVVKGVGGNTAANNIWKVAGQTANTINLVNAFDGTTNSVGNGAYTSGGRVACLGLTVGAAIADFDAAIIGTPVAYASRTIGALGIGVFDAADPTYASVPGTTTIDAIISYESGGRVFGFVDGRVIVVANATAATSATSIAVEPLDEAIASGTVIVFSNGASATLSGAAAAGDRALTVSALAASITAGSYGSALVSGTSDPLITSNGGNISRTLSNTLGILKLGRF